MSLRSPRAGRSLYPPSPCGWASHHRANVYFYFPLVLSFHRVIFLLFGHFLGIISFCQSIFFGRTHTHTHTHPRTHTLSFMPLPSPSPTLPPHQAQAGKNSKTHVGERLRPRAGKASCFFFLRDRGPWTVRPCTLWPASRASSSVALSGHVDSAAGCTLQAGLALQASSVQPAAVAHARRAAQVTRTCRHRCLLTMLTSFSGGPPSPSPLHGRPCRFS